MSTIAQIEANRRNAQNCTGPRTPQGKAIVSQNALCHGLRSRSAVLPGEDPTELQGLVAQLRAEFSPATPTQEILLDQMAVAYWKLGRAQRLENEVFRIRSEKNTLAGALREMLSSRETPEPEPDPPSPDEVLGTAYIRDTNSSKALTSLANYEARLERSFFRALRELTKQNQLCP